MSLYISAHLIKDYLHCKKSAWYRIFAPKSGVPNKEMLQGLAVHAAIERRIKYGEQFSSSTDDFINGCLTVFDRSFYQLVGENPKLEKSFDIPFIDDTKIVGKIDLITSSGGIFDWKTSRKPPRSIANDPQFIIYNWAYKQLYKKQPSGVYYAALTTGGLIPFQESLSFETMLFEEIIPTIIRDFKDKKLPRTGTLTGGCYRCPFSIDCLGGKNVVDSKHTT
jgi:hypothetical protein